MIGILVVIFVIAAVVLNSGSNSPAVTPKPPSAPVVASNPQNNNSQQSASPQPASQPTAPVYNNGWDGSVRQVKEWLKDNLKDPDSFKRLIGRLCRQILMAAIMFDANTEQKIRLAVMILQTRFSTWTQKVIF